jgi:hypothetical protein
VKSHALRLASVTALQRHLSAVFEISHGFPLLNCFDILFFYFIYGMHGIALELKEIQMFAEKSVEIWSSVRNNFALFARNTYRMHLKII